MNRRLALVPTLIAVIALAIGMVAQGYAQARPAATDLGVTQIVICGDAGAETIRLDRHGNPIEDDRCLRNLCSACIAAPTLTSLDSTAQVMPPLTMRAADTAPVVARAAFVRPLSIPHPRGPPAQTRD